MTINIADIKLLESEKMADTTDSGGRRTSDVIQDGVPGNIFPKVSRLDSTYGRVNLRKVYGAVLTANKDTYAGAHAIITDRPDNNRIHVCLFSTSSDFDTRTAARDRIESYVASGPESRMVLMGRQLTGQMQVIAYQREDEPLPEIGDVYCLSTESGSVVTNQQYVRIVEVASEVRTFTDTVGGSAVDFRRRVITMSTGTPLRADFVGPDTPSRYSNVSRPALIRTTTVVDAARYFGIKKLVSAATAGDLSLQLESVYTQIVPTTNQETPLSLVPVSGLSTGVDAKSSPFSEVVSSSWSTAHSTMLTMRGIKRGSLTLSASGQTSATDDGLGSFSSASFVGTVDYDSGLITRTGGVGSSSAVTATYIPQGPSSQPAHTRRIDVDLSNRGTVHSLVLGPLPSPASVTVDYRALGRWYRLRDNGDGALKGRVDAEGVGNINYATGALILTLGALPDVSSAILISWSTGVHYTIREGATNDSGGVARFKATLPNIPISHSGVTMSYIAGGVTYNCTVNASGVISGTGVTGSLEFTTGVIDLKFTSNLPDSSSVMTWNYNQVKKNSSGDPEVFTQVAVASANSMNIGGPIVAGTIVGQIPFGKLGLVRVRDDAAGFIVVDGGRSATGLTYGGATIGTINYTTGDIVINAGVPYSYQQWVASAPASVPTWAPYE